MKRYTKRTVFDYVNGNDIGDETLTDEQREKLLEQYEANPKFMADAVCVDKEVYILCSNEIRKNYEFVCKVLEKYKSDVDFSLKVFNEYLNGTGNDDLSTKEEQKHFEILIRMRNITKNEDEDVKESFIKCTNVLFNCNKFMYDNDKRFFTPETKSLIGTEFGYYMLKYDDNEIIMDFLAEKCIENIIFKTINLEAKLHQIYRKYEILEKYGVYNAVIGLISYYDTILAEYAFVNTRTLDGLKKELKRIKRNWSNYDNYQKQVDMDLEIDKYDRIYSRVMDYCENNACLFDYWEALDYVADQFGVKDKMKEYVAYDMNPIDYIHEKIDKEEISEEEGNKIIERIINEIKEHKDINILGYYNDLFTDVTNFANVKHIKEIQKIFAEELRVELKEKKKVKTANNHKVINFNKE